MSARLPDGFHRDGVADIARDPFGADLAGDPFGGDLVGAGTRTDRYRCGRPMVVDVVLGLELRVVLERAGPVDGRDVSSGHGS